MNIDRLRKIIEYSEKNRTQMDSKVAKFYSFTGISEDKDMLNILQIVRPALRQRGYIVLEIPFADEEIGGSIVTRVSRFVNEFHILKATFKFCTRLSTFVMTFPFFSLLL